MNAKKLDVEQPKPREYMRVEDIDRQRLGILQFEHGLRIYIDGAGRMVVEKGEYAQAIAKQRSR